MEILFAFRAHAAQTLGFGITSAEFSGELNESMVPVGACFHGFHLCTMNTMTAQDALRNATLEIEQYVATGGWDGPIRVFALVNAKRALDAHPELSNELPADVDITSIEDPETLFSVEQEDLPQADSVEELLGKITWPDGVDGAAISMERIIIPPSVEHELPKNDDEAMKVLQTHPQRKDIRMVVGVLRTGETWSAIRTRQYDNAAFVASQENLVPGVASALHHTFE